MKTFVLGLGVSGKAAAEFLLRQKREVLGCDAQLEGVEDLRKQGMTTCLDTEAVDWSEIEQCVSRRVFRPNTLFMLRRSSGGYHSLERWN